MAADSDEGLQATEVAPIAPKNKDAFKIFVGGLPFKCDKDKVKEHFSVCGGIEWLHLPPKVKGKPQGIAFVSFRDDDSVCKALALNGTELDGFKLKINRAANKPPKEDLKERDLFIGGLPFTSTAGEIKQHFSQYGKIEHFSMPKHAETKKSKGVAFLTFKTVADAKEALALQGTKYKTGTLTVRLASDKQVEMRAKTKGNTDVVASKAERAPKQIPEPEEFEVIFKNLAYSTKEETLREALVECGSIKAIRLPLTKKKKCTGIAFVSFEDKKGMKRALKLSGTSLGHREIHVEKACAREEVAPVVEAKVAGPDKEGKKRKQLVDGGLTTPEPKRPKKEKVNHVVGEDGLTKEEILERTKANRERRKAKRRELQAAKISDE